MKKCFALILCFLLFAFLPSLIMAEEDNSGYIISGEWKYSVLEDGTAKILAYMGPMKTDISIPEVIDGIVVTAIGEGAFYWYDFITSIEIPEGIVQIEKDAFGLCTLLEKISIPDSVVSIGENAFYKCVALSDISVNPGHSCFEMVDGALCNKREKSLVYVVSESLSEIYEIPEGIQIINDNAFCENTSMKCVIIPESVTNIGQDAFSYCYSLLTAVVSQGSYADQFFSSNNIHCVYKDVLSASSEMLEDIIGSWQFSGMLIDNIRFDLPDYYINMSLEINQFGLVTMHSDDTEEEGYWENHEDKLVFVFKYSGEIECAVSENELLLKNHGVELIFINDKQPKPVIPVRVNAIDDRQFNGEWKISRVVSQYCRLTGDQLINERIDGSLSVCITDDSAEVVFSSGAGGDSTSITYGKKLSEGVLNLTNSGIGKSVQLMLSDTGELLMPVVEKQSLLYICLVNVSTDNNHEYVVSDSSDAQVMFVPEKGLSVIIPPEIASVSRDADSSDSFYHKGYLDYEYLHQYMVENNMYLFGMIGNPKCELSFQIVDYSESDFNTASDALLTTYANQLKVSLGWTAKDVKYDFYQGLTKKAIRIRYMLETLFAGNQYIVLYFTTHESELLKMQFLSYGDDITADQEKMIQEIFDSIEWREPVKESNVVAEQASDIRNDSESEIPEKEAVESSLVQYDEKVMAERKGEVPFTLVPGVYLVGKDVYPGSYYVGQVTPSDYDYSRLWVYSRFPSKSSRDIIFSDRFELGGEQKEIVVEEGVYVAFEGGDLTFCLSPIPDDYYHYEVPEGMFMPIGYYNVGEDIPAGLYNVFSGSIIGGCISVFPEGTEPDDLGMYMHMVSSQESVAVNASNADGKTIILRDGKVACVDSEVVLRKIRDLTDEEKVEEPLEWEW